MATCLRSILSGGVFGSSGHRMMKSFFVDAGDDRRSTNHRLAVLLPIFCDHVGADPQCVPGIGAVVTVVGLAGRRRGGVRCGCAGLLSGEVCDRRVLARGVEAVAACQPPSIFMVCSDAGFAAAVSVLAALARRRRQLPCGRILRCADRPPMMTEPTIMRPLPFSTPSWTPTVSAFSASVWMSITENFSASAAALAACLSSARNHDACVSSGLVGVPYTRTAGTWGWFWLSWARHWLIS